MDGFKPESFIQILNRDRYAGKSDFLNFPTCRNCFLVGHTYFYYYKAIIKCYKHSYIVTK